jgi:hypothetical protein
MAIAADMVEHIARLAWEAGRPFMRKPLLRVALVRPLGVITHALNTLGARDKQFQVFMSCVLVEALASARMWGEAISAADHAMRTIPSRTLHRALLTWKAYCLAQSGRNVLSEMGKVGGTGGTWQYHLSVCRQLSV